MDILMLIDDDYEVLVVNQKYFQNEGYKVCIFKDALTALDALNTIHPSCIILDVMMPGIDGMQALPRIRNLCDAPIIFLTGKDSEDDKISGLLSGADDYMIKPYSLKELSARIKVQLRKSSASSASSNIISYEPLSIDVMKHKVFYNTSDEISLSNREYELLNFLVTHSGDVIDFETIGLRIWGVYNNEDRKSIMVMTSRLRKKLERYKGLENCIETVYGKGYKFIPPNKHSIPFS